MARIVTFGGLAAGKHTWYDKKAGGIGFAYKDDEVSAHDMVDPTQYVANMMATIAGTENGGGAQAWDIIKRCDAMLVAIGVGGGYSPTNPLTWGPIVTAIDTIRTNYNTLHEL